MILQSTTRISSAMKMLCLKICRRSF